MRSVYLNAIIRQLEDVERAVVVRDVEPLLAVQLHPEHGANVVVVLGARRSVNAAGVGEDHGVDQWHVGVRTEEGG